MRASLKNAFQAARWEAHVGTLYVRAWLRQWQSRQTRYIGITGSAGKTTAKDLCSLILSASGPTVASARSCNAPSSVAETILETNGAVRFCVIELGASKPGAFTWPLRLLKPDIGVLTVIGRDHYSAFKNVEAIASEKGKLIEALPPDGTAVLNADDPLIRSIGERCKCRIIWFGQREGVTLRLLDATSRWPEPLRLTIEHEHRTFEVRTQLHGAHLATPVLAALGVALAAGIPLEQAIPLLANAKPSAGRMEIVRGDDGVVFIRDDWKAPYWSLQPPLEFLRDADADRKVAVVGTISDVSGDDTKKYKRIATEIRQHAELVVFVGPHAHRALRARKDAHDESIQGFSSIRDADAYLRSELRAGDLVLLKGSAKADHLVRLMLNREKPIQCWRQDCGLNLFCDRCGKLYRPDPAGQSTSTSAIIEKYDSPSTHSPILGTQPALPTPIVVGLGNPGDQYHHTLHNVGYRVLDELASAQGSVWVETPDGWVSSVRLGTGAELTLLKPAANMNNTGPKIRQFLHRHGADASQCIVVHDDIDLELGTVRLKLDGGDGGHKGVRSVITSLGTPAIRRLRIGVRQPGDTGKAQQRVLQDFSSTQEALLAQSLSLAVTAIDSAISISPSPTP